jgi:biotin---protein ligase
MHVVERFSLLHGTAVVARQQSEGTGRRGNQWLSPEGCAMFSMQLHVPVTTNLGSERFLLMQHLPAVAIVHGIRSNPGYEVDLARRLPIHQLPFMYYFPECGPPT